MGKRIIYHVDSPQSENLYYSLCINLSEGLARDLLLLEPSSLASFEHFYFAHKEDVEIKCFVADRLYAGIIGLFAVVLCNKPEEVGIMNSVLENVYLSYSREDIRALVYDHDQDILLSFITEIRKELLALDEDIARTLVARCHDMSNAILQSQFISFPSSTYADDTIVSFGYKELNTTLGLWLKSGDSYESYRHLNRPYDSIEQNNETLIQDWKNDAQELDIIAAFGQEMIHIIEKATYEYESLSEEEKMDLTNLWILMITVQYQGILPSSFYRSIKRIVIH